MSKIVELNAAEIANVKGATRGGGWLADLWANVTGQAGKIRIH